MRIRDLIGTGVVLLTTAVASAPAAAAPPDRRVEPSGAALEAELAELFTDACGVPVTVDAEGRVTYKTFYAADGSVVRQQNTYAQRFVVTNTTTGVTSTLHDVGPDRFLFRDGRPVLLQQVGRSTTGSGTIGRTVLDISGEEPQVLSRSGKTFGSFVDVTCEAIG